MLPYQVSATQLKLQLDGFFNHYFKFVCIQIKSISGELISVVYLIKRSLAH